MLRNLVTDIADAVGAGVYIVSYPVVFVGWHLVGRPVSQAVKNVVVGSRQHEVDLLIEEAGSIEALKELFLRAYYNTLVREQQDRQLGAAA